jgi:hypothetical protein
VEGGAWRVSWCGEANLVETGDGSGGEGKGERNGGERELDACGRVPLFLSSAL